MIKSDHTKVNLRHFFFCCSSMRGPTLGERRPFAPFPHHSLVTAFFPLSGDHFVSGRIEFTRINSYSCIDTIIKIPILPCPAIHFIPFIPSYPRVNHPALIRVPEGEHDLRTRGGNFIDTIRNVSQALSRKITERLANGTSGCPLAQHVTTYLA